MDLRMEIDELLKEWGHRILYIRKTQSPCLFCGGPDYDCTVCFGTGYQVQKETMTVRRDMASTSETWPRLTSIKEVGHIHVPAYIYYLPFDKNPKLLDLIIDNDSAIEINSTNPMYGHNGRIEYHVVAGEEAISKRQFIRGAGATNA